MILGRCRLDSCFFFGLCPGPLSTVLHVKHKESYEVFSLVCFTVPSYICLPI